MTPRSSSALAAATLVVSAAGVGVLAATPAAQAAMCSGSSGVNVVVDFTNNPDGGGPTSACDPDGGGEPGSRVFPHAGYALTYATRQQGFVCRINGKASSDPCVNASPADAYWGLFWSDGSDGRWHYASTGVGSVSVPAGGSLAFVWQNGGTTDLPPYAAPEQAPAPSPDPSPTSSPQPTPRPGPSATSASPTGGAALPSQGSTSAGPAGPGPTATQQASPAAKRSTKAQDRSRRPRKASPSATGSTNASPTAAAPAEDVSSASAQESADTTLPAWVTIVVLVGLGVAAAAAVVLRRRS